MSVKNLGDTDAARCIQWQISCLIFISKRLASFYTGHSCFQLTGAVICNRYRDGSRSRIVDHSCTCRIRSSFCYRIFIYPCFSECDATEVDRSLSVFYISFLNRYCSFLRHWSRFYAFWLLRIRYSECKAIVIIPAASLQDFIESSCDIYRICSTSFVCIGETQ